MCVLQDFEALTPNLLARTVETVEGGGVIVLLLKTLDSLKQLYAMSMDVHARYRTEAHQDVVGRFNERFILSLASNKSCIVIDDQLNILPISSHVKNLPEIPARTSETAMTKEEAELKEIKDKFHDSQPTGVLLGRTRTLDQAKALLEFIDSITDKKLDRTVALTAARGRGKSAALGLAMAAAVGFGYSNIFVTSPSPENLHTLFDFLFKGFDAMEYEEHTDYDIIQSTNPEFHNAVVRVNIHEKNNHRQTIQYLHPSDAHKLGQAELVVIDEAAAIPLPLVKKLLGPYLVFMSSTINGYEGTGRSLSLKLLDQLRKQSNPTTVEATKATSANQYRALREVVLEESIRYKPGDNIEDWLNRLLCLDANMVQALPTGSLFPEKCELYYINRDTLFSYHKASEAFLQRIMSLFVASHYKNTPNDLQMMSDAPAHHLFCLLGPTDGKSLPEVLCAIQVCLEGEISKKNIMNGLSRGSRASGDLIPWTMAQQFQDDNFPSLSGARIVRIATHPTFQGMGFGKRAMHLLEQYYERKLTGLDENAKPVKERVDAIDPDDVTLLQENIGPRDNLPPLLLRLEERKPENLDYLGVSFGLTQQLLRFWKGRGFTPTYLRQTANDLTGEHSVVMLKLLCAEEKSGTSTKWLPEFWTDFRRRMVNLMGFEFRKFSPNLSLSILSNQNQAKRSVDLTHDELSHIITPYDLKRLQLYSNNMADYHLVTDLIPSLAKLYFLNQLGKETSLSATQECILVGVGLQCKTVDSLAEELDFPVSQLLGLYNNLLKKLTKALNRLHEAEIAKSIDDAVAKNDVGSGVKAALPKQTMEQELEEAAEDVKRQQQENRDRMKYANLTQYQIKGDDAEWDKALSGKGTKSLVSVKSGEKPLMQDDGGSHREGSAKKKKKRPNDSRGGGYKNDQQKKKKIK